MDGSFSFDVFPDEIWLEICEKLDRSSQRDFRLVCRGAANVFAQVQSRVMSEDIPTTQPLDGDILINRRLAPWCKRQRHAQELLEYLLSKQELIEPANDHPYCCEFVFCSRPYPWYRKPQFTYGLLSCLDRNGSAFWGNVCDECIFTHLLPEYYHTDGEFVFYLKRMITMN
jgi:hypothetical protein